MNAVKKKIKIKINGKETDVYAGDTVLASLVSAGYTILKKSRKLNEARGPVCGMGVCYECQVTINGTPGQRACMAEVQDAMTVLTNEI